MSKLGESKAYTRYEACHTSSNDDVNFTLGRVLTIVDASIADPVQRKAVKDLVKGEFTDLWCNHLRDNIACAFKALARDFCDDWGNSDGALGESFPSHVKTIMVDTEAK